MDKATLSVSLLALAAAAAVAVMAAPAKAGDTMPIMPTGGNLSFADLLVLAQQAGFQGADAVTAAAIALAESYPPGNPNSIGDQALAPSNGPSYGLWQINTGTRAHPEMAAQNLYDPQTNANAAFVIYSQAGNSFRPWSTFGSGKYLQFIPSGFGG